MASVIPAVASSSHHGRIRIGRALGSSVAKNCGQPKIRFFAGNASALGADLIDAAVLCPSMERRRFYSKEISLPSSLQGANPRSLISLRGFATIQVDSTDSIFSSPSETTNAVNSEDGSSISELADTIVRHSHRGDIEAAYESWKLLSPDIATLGKFQLDSVCNAIVEACVTHQSNLIEKVKDLDNPDAASSLTEQRLAMLNEIRHIAELLTEIVDSIPQSTSRKHYEIAMLNSWVEVCQASRGLKANDYVKVAAGIPQQIQYLMRFQDQLSALPTNRKIIDSSRTKSADDGTHISIESYNVLLRAWSVSKEYLRGSNAQRVFDNIPQPNGESFRLLMRAWCLSDEIDGPLNSFGCFTRIMRRLDKNESEIELTIDDYHLLLQTCSMSGNKISLLKLRSILQMMERAYREGKTTLQPDLQCYRILLVSLAYHYKSPGVGEVVDEVMTVMNRRMIEPDSICYSSAISAWKRMARSHTLDGRTDAAARSLELLREMSRAYHRFSTVSVQPQISDYNNVLEALARSKSFRGPRQALKLLESLEKGSMDDGSDGRIALCPSAATYRWTFRNLLNSNSPEKFRHAVHTFNSLKKRFEDKALVESTDNQVADALSSFLRVCATCDNRNDSSKKEIMLLALQSVNDMRKLGLEVNSNMYVGLLKACVALITQVDDRQRFLETIIRKCCEEGMLNMSVLKEFRGNASSYLYAKVILANCREVNGKRYAQDSWSRNVASKVGKGNYRLTLDFKEKPVITKAEAEKRMRTLRGHSNRRALQGGRAEEETDQTELD